MKRKILLIITVIFLSLVTIYFILCYGFKRVQKIDGCNIINYKGNDYYLCDDFTPALCNYKKLKVISFEKRLFDMFTIRYYAETKDEPDIIISPSYSAYFKNDIDYKEKKLQIYYWDTSKTNDEYVGCYSLNDLTINEVLYDINYNKISKYIILSSDDVFGLYLALDVIELEEYHYIKYHDKLYEISSILQDHQRN